MSTEAAQVLDVAPTSSAPAADTAPVSTPAPLEQAAAQPAVDNKVSARLEIIARREAKALEQDRQVSAKLKELDEKLKRYENFESAKTNPNKALELLGLNYNELTQAKLNNDELPPELQIKKVKDDFDSYKTEQEAAKKAQEETEAREAKEQAEAQEQKAVSDFKNQIGVYLKDNLSRYELIQFEEQSDLVFEVIDTHYNRTIDPKSGVGKVMTIAEAADKVELYLEQKYLKSRDLQKVKAFSGLPRAEAKKEAAKQNEIPGHKPKTLSNQLSTANTGVPKKGQVTDEDRIAKALAYAKTLGLRV